MEYLKGQVIDVKAALVTDIMYNDPYHSFTFCPEKTTGLDSPKLANILRDFTFSETQYELRMAENISCKLLCNNKDEPLTWNAEETNRVIPFIKNRPSVQL